MLACVCVRCVIPRPINVFGARTIAIALTVIEQFVRPPIDTGHHFHGFFGAVMRVVYVWCLCVLRTNARLRMRRVAVGAFDWQRRARFGDVEMSLGRFYSPVCIVYR